MSDSQRRNFLKTVAAAAGSAVLPFPASPHSRSRGGKGRAPIVDTHMHVWSDDLERFPFAHPTNPNLKPPPIAATSELLLAEMDEYGVDFAVLVQVIYLGWDNRYVAECLRAQPRRYRAQGLIDPVDPGRAAKLEYWMREHRLSGMRFSPTYYKGRDEWLDSEESVPLWRKAEELGAIFNFFIATQQLPRLQRMVRRFPRVNVVIDHMGRLDLKGPDPAAEARKLVEIASHPNVWVKVSELQTMSLTKEYPFEDTFPWVRRLYDAVGSDRLLWGTGFPGATRAQDRRIPLAQELALIRREIPFLTNSDREKILGRNAVRLWGFQS